MKKILYSIGAVLVVVLAMPGTAWAMVVDNPTGQFVNGWYKDSFSVQIHFGNTTCVGSGTANTFTYNSSTAHEGSHQYYFLADQFDNPYLSIDGSQPQLLTATCPTVPNPSYQLVRQIQIGLDAQAPSVSITSPLNNPTTTAPTYDITGTANDSSSGVQSVQLIVNGAPGPMATYGGGTFTATVPLNTGTNSIQALALDSVGHSATSNTVIITRGSSSGGGGTGGTGSSGSSGSSSSGSQATAQPQSQSASSSSTNAVPSAQGSVKFNQNTGISLSQGALDQPSNPNVALAESGFPSVNTAVYYSLLVLLLILLLLVIFIIWRFRPVFTHLDRENSGLRRRIIIIVTLPSLLPLLGLGFLGYQQLSSSLKSSLSQELARAAQTSAIKLEREFAIRQGVITTNASDVLQIQSQFQTQFTQLAQQDTACASLMKSAIPSGRYYSQVPSSADCLPFLATLAQLSSPSASTLNSYLQALTDGYNNALTSLQADEQQRVNELLAAVRSYFPETTEMVIIGSGKPAQVLATLPDAGTMHPITVAHTPLLTQAPNSVTVLFDSTLHQLLMSYPVTDTHGSVIGAAIVSLNIQYPAFIPAIWQATPKPYAQDQVYFVNGQGQQIYPINGHPLTTAQAKQAAGTGEGTLLELQLSKTNTLAARVSPVTGTDWSIAVGAPPATMLAPIAGVQRLALIAIACFILISLLLGILFVSRIATEIEQLFRGALRFASGEFEYRIQVPTHDELRMLGVTMNRMAAEIKAAQAAIVDKDKEFINIATHELKAPMTSIIGNLSMITDDGMGTVDETARKLIDQAYGGTVRLRDLVTDMLDVARLEAGKEQFKLEPLNIMEITKGIVDMQSIPAKQATVTLDYTPATGLPNVMADKNKLQIIITNFVSNAIKYNRSGGTITISQTLKDGKLVTAVADTGLGIPEDQQGHIFEKFYRVQHEDRANVPGTGLGMFITKQFIESMGGSVWFTSVHGKGTTFYFSLPLATNVQLQPTATPQAPASAATSPIAPA